MSKQQFVLIFAWWSVVHNGKELTFKILYSSSSCLRLMVATCWSWPTRHHHVKTAFCIDNCSSNLHYSKVLTSFNNLLLISLYEVMVATSSFLLILFSSTWHRHTNMNHTWNYSFVKLPFTVLKASVYSLCSSSYKPDSLPNGEHSDTETNTGT